MTRQFALLAVGIVFCACCPSARAQGRLDPEDFVGKWTATYLEDQPATFELEALEKGAKTGRFTSEGSLGRPFGGPNKLNATRWQTQSDELRFVHINARGDLQVILAGKVEFEKGNRKFKMTLSSGHWVEVSRLKGKVVRFER